MKKSMRKIAGFTMALVMGASMGAFAGETQTEQVTESAEQAAPMFNPFDMHIDVDVKIDDDFIVLHPGESQKVNMDVKVGELPEGIPDEMADRFTTASFMTNDRNVARIDSEGTITAISEGVADITVVVANQPQAKIAVTVVPEKDDTPRVKMGIQMFNFNVDLNAADDQAQTGMLILRRLAAMGYDGVEWVQSQFTDGKLFGKYEPEEVKGYMDELGLKSAGMHPSETTEETVQLCEILDVPLLWASCSFRADVDMDPKDIDASVEQVNTVDYPAARELLKGTDIQIMYHNHGEFGKTSDGDYALNKLDYDWQQLDFYWAVKGLQSYDDAMAYLEERADKIGSIHLKDGTKDVSRTDDICPWGMGEFDLQAVIDVARTHDNIQWVIVESDSPTNNGLSGIEDAGVTMDYAKANLDLTRVEE